MLNKIIAFLMSIFSFLFPFAAVRETVAEAELSQSSALYGVVRTETVAGRAGDTVEVGIFLDENPGFVAMRLFIEYDSSFLTLIRAQDLIEGDISTFGNDLSANPYTLIWVDSLSDTDYTLTGRIAVLSFKIADNALVGGYEINVRVDSGSTFNSELKAAAFMRESGSVIVTDKEPPALAAAEGSGTVIDNERGYIYGLAPGLDEKTLLSDYLTVTGDGSISLSGSVSIGTGTVVNLNDSDGQTIETYTVIIFGDANGDGFISATDIVNLKGIISGSESPTRIAMFSLDTNGDGVLTSTDLIMLKAAVEGAQILGQNR